MSIFDKVKKTVIDSLPDVVTTTDISGQSDEMVWRYNSASLMTGTRLVVRESQEAIFMRNGEIAQIFGPGAYDLETGNIPVAKQILTMMYGGKNPNAAEIWFVNKSSIMGISWGTPTPVTIEDSKFGFPLTLGVRVNGSINVKVADSKLLFTELAGLGRSFTVQNLNDSVKDILISRLRKAIGDCMTLHKLSFVQLQNSITTLEDPIRESVTEEFQKYGLYADGCFVKGFSVVDDESWARYKNYEDRVISQQLDISLEADRKQLQYMDTDIEADRMQRLNYDYSTERQFNVLQAAAENTSNPAVRTPVGLGVGLGTGMAVGRRTSEVAGALIVDPLLESAGVTKKEVKEEAKEPKKETATCVKCGGAYQEGSKFCPECGYLVKAICLSCGAAVEDGKFCAECGKKAVICANCGSDTEVDAETCGKCDTALPKEMVCSKCGTTFADGRKFCSECGEKL